MINAKIQRKASNLFLECYKFLKVTSFIFKQYLSVAFSRSAKDFFTETYIKTIENDRSLPFSGGLKRKSLDEIFPGIDQQNFYSFHTYKSSFTGKYDPKGHYLVSSRELFTLGALVSFLKPKTVMEIGTFKGWSLANMILNALPETKIFSLDILHVPSCNDHIDKLLDSDNVMRFFADSKFFDFSEFNGKMDLVFVDACHFLPEVKIDSENAFKLISPGGVIIWHDFNLEHRDVYNYLIELGREKELISIKGTSIVIFVDKK